MLNQSFAKSAQKVFNILKKSGIDFEIKELPQSARTAQEAAEAIGCQIEQIAKSIVFKGIKSGKPVLAIASGAKRIDEKKLSQIFGEKVVKADANFVREKTGFVIGGVSPVGHQQKISVFIDKNLFSYPKIWTAAGNPHTVFCLTPKQLLKITQGKIASFS